MNKKGQVGLGLVKAVIITVLIIAIVAFVVMISVNSLVSINPTNTASGNFTNQTVVFNATTTIPVLVGLDQVSLTNVLAYNATGTLGTNDSNSLKLLNANNYTISGGTLVVNQASEYNNSRINVTFSFTQEVGSQESSIGQNVSAGVSGFFSNVGAWFGLLAVVVVILIIGIVLLAIGRFRTGNTGL